MSKISSQIFKSYDVRGIYPTEITVELAYQVGCAFGKYLKTDRGEQLPFQVVLGQDMRGSSPFLAREVVRGLNDQGIDVLDAGVVPTPAFYYAVAFKDAVAGVMVTASHNPKEYNGFKFCYRKAAPIGRNTGLEKIRSYAAETYKPANSSARGKLLPLPNVTAEYVGHDLSYLNSGKIKNLKIAADPANTMGAVYLDELFLRVPATPIKINWELNGNMPSHEANPLKEETLQQLKALIRNEKADFGIATDGDGDRLAFLDEQAEVIPPAILIGLIAQKLLQKNPGAKIGYDLRLSRLTREMIEEAGGIAIETNVGHSNIKALMSDQDILFAGELSQHYYYRENFNFESPVFVISQLLLLRSELDKPFSEIWRPHQKYAHSGEINFEVADKEGVLAKLEVLYQDGKISKLDGLKVEFEDWWFNVRPSNTEPLLRLNLEAEDESLMKQKIEEISKIIKSA